MSPRALLIVTCGAVVIAVVAAAWLQVRRDTPGRSRAIAEADCAAMWSKGVELAGAVGRKQSQAYFDTGRVPGAPDRISGIVLFPEDRHDEPLADAPIGMVGQLHHDGCGIQLKAADADSDVGAWQLRMEGRSRVTGSRRLPDGRMEDIVFRVVPETRCDGAGEWRTFTSLRWPITFDYPGNWVLTADEDDVNVECPSVTRLASGGAWLTFERGRFQSSSDPYWFVRRPHDDWRVNDDACAGRSGPAPAVPCAPARRTSRDGMTIVQGAAGEHRLFRPGLGYLGPGHGITRYLFVIGDEWVSLDSAGANGHFDDVGIQGGPVLMDGAEVGDRIVRSISRR
jgi:hypothetical protein